MAWMCWSWTISRRPAGRSGARSKPWPRDATAILGAAYRRRACCSPKRSAPAAPSTSPARKLWQIEPGFRAFVSRDRKAQVIEAKAVMLATGAQERPVPFPGLDAAGRAHRRRRADSAEERRADSCQAGLDRRQRTACRCFTLMQLLRAGGQIAGYLDTTPPGRWRAALRHLPGALRPPAISCKGLALEGEAQEQAAFRSSGTWSDSKRSAMDSIEAIRYRTDTVRRQTVPADILLVHEGVVPNIHAALALGLRGGVA